MVPAMPTLAPPVSTASPSLRLLLRAGREEAGLLPDCFSDVKGNREKLHRKGREGGAKDARRAIKPVFRACSSFAPLAAFAVKRFCSPVPDS
jgi:hypothetical protein